MVGLAKRVIDKRPVDNTRVLAACESLLADGDYRQACERATADEANIRKRLEAATTAFAAI
jgi:hypothetical protein